MRKTSSGWGYAAARKKAAARVRAAQRAERDARQFEIVEVAVTSFSGRGKAKRLNICYRRGNGELFVASYRVQ